MFGGLEERNPHRFPQPGMLRCIRRGSPRRHGVVPIMADDDWFDRYVVARLAEHGERQRVRLMKRIAKRVQRVAMARKC